MWLPEGARIENFNDAVDALKQSYNYMVETVEATRETLEKFSKDKEIKAARDKAAYYRDNSLIILSNTERQRINSFKMEHYEKCSQHKKNAGNTYIYTITATGIGSIIKIKCPICGEEIDVTDTEGW